MQKLSRNVEINNLTRSRYGRGQKQVDALGSAHSAEPSART